MYRGIDNDHAFSCTSQTDALSRPKSKRCQSVRYFQRKHILQHLHVVQSVDVEVARCGNKDVALRHEARRCQTASLVTMTTDRSLV